MKMELTSLKKIALFGVLILFVTVLLSVVNWIPLLVQKQKLTSFSSLDSASKALHIKKIYLPVYLPEHLNLSWPPSEIYGQDAPFNALVMYLTFKGKNEIGLAMHQTAAQAPYQLEPRMKIRADNYTRHIVIKGRKADLYSAVCDNAIPCNRLSWEEAGTIITLVGKCTAQDLIKIASSIIPDA